MFERLNHVTYQDDKVFEDTCKNMAYYIRYIGVYLAIQYLQLIIKKYQHLNNTVFSELIEQLVLLESEWKKIYFMLYKIAILKQKDKVGGWIELAKKKADLFKIFLHFFLCQI
jgi:hypothetical protein